MLLHLATFRLLGTQARAFAAVPVDPYRVLGLSRGCDKKTARLRYLALAKVVHPDAAAGHSAADFAELACAYEQIQHDIELLRLRTRDLEEAADTQYAGNEMMNEVYDDSLLMKLRRYVLLR